MEHTILCLNAGSSSLKFSVYRMAGATEERLLAGAAEAIGEAEGSFWLRGADGRLLVNRNEKFAGHENAILVMFAELTAQGARDFAAAGHRIVHGGPYFCEPQRIDARVRDRLRELIPFAPLHLPGQIAMIDGVEKQCPGLAQVACFDTAFHRRMPEVARRLALPRHLWDQGVWRYGFHGLSYEFVVNKLGPALGRRAIVAHLGNGASMAALKDGASVDTSMGLTPAGGFMMGTRSGDIDPGVLLYLLREGWTSEQLDTLINHQSGLIGVSAVAGDMKTLLERRAVDVRAAQAVEMFCYQVRKFIGAYAAALNGLDTLVFTGGIGERAAEVRAEICQGLEFLGVELDTAANAQNGEIISRSESPCQVRVVETDEDLIIARHSVRLVSTG